MTRDVQVATAYGWARATTRFACVVGLLLTAVRVNAADACDRLLRQWIEEGRAANLTDARYNAALERLAQLRRTYGNTSVGAVDTVFKAAEHGWAPPMMEQFLERRSLEEARTIFELAASFADERARRGVARSAGLPPFQDVEPGASVYAFASKTIIAPGAKQQFFRALDVIAVHDGASRLLRRAGVANNYGAVFEVAADAKLAETGKYGSLTGVDYDVSGANARFRLVDTTTETGAGERYAIQSKSSYNQSRDLVLGGDISEADLNELRDEAQLLSAKPILMSNVGFDQALADACTARQIIMEPYWVRVIE